MEVGSLPVELWRVILAYLPLPDLGRCCQVCRAWRELILSLDNTRWRQLCLGCPECRHPNWPSKPHLEPPSWREALKQHALATRTWTQNGPDLQSSTCLLFFRRRKDRRVWHVGSGCEFETLRGALAVVGPYDRVVLHPGVYEEQAEVTLKVPVELVGLGQLGEVSLLVCVEQQCPTARLCNLVFMPPWFSTVVYKTSWGHVQLDNCNFEGAQLQIRGPGTCQARFCAFSQGSSVHFLGVALSLLNSCDFSGSDTSSVTVEGPSVSERNWACKHLAALTRTFSSRGLSGSTGTLRCPQDFSDSGPQAPFANVKVEQVSTDCWQRRTKVETECHGTAIEDDWSDGEHSEGADGNHDGDSIKHFSSSDYKIPYDNHGLSHMLKPQLDGSLPPSSSDPPAVTPETLSFEQELERDPDAQMLAASTHGCIIRFCLFREGKGGVHLSNYGQARLEGNVFQELNYAVRCIQNSTIVMLQNEVSQCRASGVFLRLSAQGLIAENNIHSNGEAGLDIRKGANPIIVCNKIHSGVRSGVVVLGNGKGSIRSNQIYNNKEAGVYILFSGNPVVSGNHIFRGQAAGIAVNENGRGMITENVIRENQWGGVDIRRGGDPVLRNNYICHGFSDGVVVGERGRGLIEGNHVYCNKGCGVWVMSSSLPQLLRNFISHNCMYGLAVFCRKDTENIEAREGNWLGQEGIFEGGNGGEIREVEGEGRDGQQNLNEEGELFGWESDLDSEDEHHSARRSISVALIESNCISYNGAVGLYVKSSEPLNVFANLLNCNYGTGIAVLQSSQLIRLAANCVLENGRGGITVEKDCRVELRGNGIYKNNGHGIRFSGSGQIVENDVIGNGGYGIQVSGSADIRLLRNRVQPAGGCGIAVLGQVKGAIHDNVLFQGHPGNKKELLYMDPSNESCGLRNNSILKHKNSSVAASWVLENPPPRPQASSPSNHSSYNYPSRLGISMTTRISTTVESGCHSGSMFCSIL
ncbi:F-box only protein 10 [Thalassophryne amazonica]|uniref:F-box only protein 10 n=1 Tax=Thalassophryne amazonica TaxID=390379 RepID=UPI00147249D4|nr:F-box only protein 10 [Thalassophryne amazonica]XP_034043391.1 F-box only protein 10 [Thalassophryne amazonica]